MNDKRMAVQDPCPGLMLGDLEFARMLKDQDRADLEAARREAL